MRRLRSKGPHYSNHIACNREIVAGAKAGGLSARSAILRINSNYQASEDSFLSSGTLDFNRSLIDSLGIPGTYLAKRLDMELFPFTTLGAAATLGVSVHHFMFKHGEWHLKVPHIVLSHGTAFLVVYMFCSWFGLEETAWLHLYTTYLLSLFTSIAIYRTFFHRIRHIPGPRLAALTKLWHVWQSRNSVNYLVMQRMHVQYGELVRTGMPGSIVLLFALSKTNVT